MNEIAECMGSMQKSVRRLIENRDNDVQIKSVPLPLSYVVLIENQKCKTAVLLIIRQLHFIKRIEDQAQDHADHAGKNHTGELDVSEVYLDPGETGDKDHGGQGLVAVLAVIDFGVNEDPEAGGSDHTVEQEGDSADDRSRDRLDQGR